MGPFLEKTLDPVSRKCISSIPTNWIVRTYVEGRFSPGTASVKPGLAEVHTLFSFFMKLHSKLPNQALALGTNSL